MRGNSAWMGRWAAVFASLVCSVAAACPMCGGANPENQKAYVWATALLSLLPLGLIGGLVFWVRKQYLAPEGPAQPERRGELVEPRFPAKSEP